MVDQPFYRDALVRNFIRYLVEENPQQIQITDEMKENICSVSDGELEKLVDETLEFIVAGNTSGYERGTVIKRIKEICSDQGH
ncbi:hypothetical protein [Stygiolobus caldivivus]|uniref:Uncharacterized protein n=1 Tax=Stygiolobus caldivivus TaxID=2824673 RepID=A0A8D5U504_9CREN|nr:hypothetical protein [Stygiolobus caldivivus]BCU69566.1 hypothetical protein KN1_08630 [Stygiolobus caldivivus]